MRGDFPLSPELEVKKISAKMCAFIDRECIENCIAYRIGKNSNRFYCARFYAIKQQD